MPRSTPPRHGNHRRSATIVGLGTIGSALCEHVARLPGIGRIVVVDPDDFDETNVEGQLITRDAVGHGKAVTVADRLRRIAPDVIVEPFARPVEDVPLGRLRTDVLIGCLDSRIARQTLNQAACRLGRPLIDTGVEAGGLLARVNVYRPGADTPCHECGWDPADYDQLEVETPCGGEATPNTPTRAPAALGGLAASLAGLELAKIVADDWDTAAVDRQVTIGAADHVHAITSFTRNPECRCDHAPFEPEPLEQGPADLTIAETLALDGGEAATASLFVDDKSFLRVLACPAPNCGWQRKRILRLQGRLRREQRGCLHDNTTLVPVAAHSLMSVELDTITPRQREFTLATIGLERGDIFGLRRGDAIRRFELAAVTGVER